MKTKRSFITPRINVVEADLEGVICDSIRVKGTVQEWNNKNYSSKPADADIVEPFYFES